MNLNLDKKTLMLRENDFEYLRDEFAEKKIKASVIIRTLVSRFVDQHKVNKLEVEEDFLDEIQL